MEKQKTGSDKKEDQEKEIKRVERGGIGYQKHQKEERSKSLNVDP